MARGPAKDKVAVIAPAVAVNNELEDLVRKRDAFVTSMTMLRNAAEEASRAGFAYFDHIIGTAPNGDHAYTAYPRGMSAPARATTEEPEGPLKRQRRKREKRDPDLPKRPMTAYLLFCNQGRETVKKDLGEGASHKEVIAELTKRWAEVPEDEKKAWQDLYQKNRVVYDKELAEYKASKEPHIDAIAPAVTASAAASGFTAVNHTEPAEDSDAESEAEQEAPKAVEPEESELSEAEPEEEAAEEEAAEEEEDEDEDEEEEEEALKSPSPPPPPSRPKITPRGKKATNGAGKKTPIPAPANTPAIKEKEKRKRTSSRKKAAEEEAAVADEGPKKKAKRRRKSSGD